MEGLLAFVGFSIGAAAGVKAGKAIGENVQPALEKAMVGGQFAGVTLRSALVGLGEAIARPFSSGITTNAAAPEPEQAPPRPRQGGKAGAGRAQRIAVVKE